MTSFPEYPEIFDAPDSTTAPPAARGRRGRVIGGLAVTALLTLGGAGVAAADPDGAESEATTFSSSTQDEATQYWTPQRMQAAAPAEELVAGSEVADGAVDTSETRTVPAAEATAQAQAAPAPGAQEAETAAAGGTDHVGKVFFTVDGEDYVCSGNAVGSGNESTVSTAGHCVNEAGSWASNWVFAPGYDDGETPYGLWSASDLFAADQWVSAEDMNYDVAFAVVEPESGSATLTDTVGGSGLEFNTPRGELYTSYGYPAAAPFTGETLEQCQGVGFDDTLGGTDDQAIDCDMTGGSSGGPWFAGEGPDGPQISVNSFGYTSQPNVMYGPYLGDVAEDVYQEAAAS